MVAKYACASAASILWVSSTVHAVEPSSVAVGNLALTPTVDVAVGHTDNLYNSTQNETSTWFSKVRPSFDLQGQKGGLVAGVTYSLEQGSYFSSHDDDYTDHALSGYATAEFDSRKKLEILAEYLKLHDARSDSRSGNSLSPALVDKPSKYTVKALGATYTYGAHEATGQIVVSGRVEDKSYDNFRTITAAQDRMTKTLTGTFYYRISPKTRLLAEARLRDIDYDLSSVTLDSHETRLQFGAEWDATAKTSGRVKFGVLRKDYDDDSRDTLTTSSWEAGVNWAPRTYSVFDLSTSRTAEESGGAEDYIDSTRWTLGWTHGWSDRFSTRLSHTLLNEEYEGTTVDNDTNTTALGLNYDMRRWLTLGADFSHKSFSSNIAGADYDSNEVIFRVQGSL